MLQVYLTKPLGVKFARGNDSGVYVLASAKEYGNTDPQIEVGGSNRPLRCTGSGSAIWVAGHHALA